MTHKILLGQMDNFGLLVAHQYARLYLRICFKDFFSDCAAWQGWISWKQLHKLIYLRILKWHIIITLDLLQGIFKVLCNERGHRVFPTGGMGMNSSTNSQKSFHYPPPGKIPPSRLLPSSPANFYLLHH